MANCKFCSKPTKMKNRVFCCRKCSCNWNRANGAFTVESRKRQGQHNIAGRKSPENFRDVSKRTLTKILDRLDIGCSRCGWKESTCDIHHIVMKSKGGTHEHKNLTLLCPNCHRLATNKKITKFISVEKQIGERWRKHYYAHI